MKQKHKFLKVAVIAAMLVIACATIAFAQSVGGITQIYGGKFPSLTLICTDDDNCPLASSVDEEGRTIIKEFIDGTYEMLYNEDGTVTIHITDTKEYLDEANKKLEAVMGNNSHSITKFPTELYLIHPCEITNKYVDHLYKVDKLPTCEQTGIGYVQCSMCGKKFTEPISLNAQNHTHSIKDVLKYPTCTEPGYQLVYCEHEYCDDQDAYETAYEAASKNGTYNSYDEAKEKGGLFTYEGESYIPSTGTPSRYDNNGGYNVGGYNTQPDGFPGTYDNPVLEEIPALGHVGGNSSYSYYYGDPATTGLWTGSLTEEQRERAHIHSADISGNGDYTPPTALYCLRCGVAFAPEPYYSTSVYHTWQGTRCTRCDTVSSNYKKAWWDTWRKELGEDNCPWDDRATIGQVYTGHRDLPIRIDTEETDYYGNPIKKVVHPNYNMKQEVIPEETEVTTQEPKKTEEETEITTQEPKKTEEETEITTQEPKKTEEETEVTTQEPKKTEEQTEVTTQEGTEKTVEPAVLGFTVPASDVPAGNSEVQTYRYVNTTDENGYGVTYTEEQWADHPDEIKNRPILTKIVVPKGYNLSFYTGETNSPDWEYTDTLNGDTGAFNSIQVEVQSRVYTVIWLDADTGSIIEGKPIAKRNIDEGQDPMEDVTVRATGTDKASFTIGKDTYTFDKDNPKNKLEGTVRTGKPEEPSSMKTTQLMLYFKKGTTDTPDESKDPDPTPDPENPTPPTPITPITPVTPTPPTDIDDPDTPLGPGPDDPAVDIDEPDTPLAPASDEPAEEIDEEEPPLADAPKTGDTFQIWTWIALVMISGAGAAWLSLTERKRKNSTK